MISASTASASLTSSILFAPFFLLLVAVLDQIFRRLWLVVVPYPILAVMVLPIGVLVHLTIYPSLLRLKVRDAAQGNGCKD